MELKRLLMIFATSLLALTLTVTAHADVSADTDAETEELDPFDPNIEQILENYDGVYEEETGISAHLKPDFFATLFGTGCVRFACPVYLQIVKSTQLAYLYRDGKLVSSWKVSTGVSGRSTPNFDRHPNGRVYDKYSSKKYPGGSYNGLGNMPYVVFIEGGFAVHGTPQSNWTRLGSPASHGCIRMHPDNAYSFNRLVRAFGISKTWITVQN